MRWAREDHQQRSDDRADAVAGVGHAETVGTTDLGRAHEQRVEREVHAAEAQADDDDAGEQLVEAAGQRGACGAECHDGERAGQDRSAGIALQRGPRQRHTAEGSDEVDAHYRAGSGKRDAESGGRR